MRTKEIDMEFSFASVERSIVKPGNENYRAIGRACQISRRIKNRTHYLLRHQKRTDGKPLSHRDADKYLKSHEPELYYKHPSGIAQRMTQICGEEWKSFAKAIESFKKNPAKFKAKPRSPQYVNYATTTYIPRNSFQVVEGYIVFAKKLALQPVKTRICQYQPYNEKAELTIIKEVRLVPLGNCYAVEVVYDQSKLFHEGDYCPVLDRSRVMSIDIGLSNLASFITNQPELSPVLINGNVIKSINSKYNKDCARLQSNNKGKHRKSKSAKRHLRMTDYLHKVSRYIVDYCVSNNLGTIVIGKNEQWKQKINIGKKNNQKFVFVPHAKLIEKILYKSQRLGINVIVREESYTSKASALDLDEIPDFEKGSNVKPIFSGKRVKRGLYRTRDGRLINADINGAINIIRKELGDAVVMSLFDKGGVTTPVRVSLHNTSAPKVFRTRRIEKQEKTALAA